jgi:hypothetical protein
MRSKAPYGAVQAADGSAEQQQVLLLHLSSDCPADAAGGQLADPSVFA